MKKFLFIILAFLSLTSCRTTTKTITEYRDRDVFREVVKYDSIFKHDSVFVSVLAFGDTVFVNKDRWHTEFKYVYFRDTLSVRDTSRYVQKVVVEKKVTRLFSYFDWGIILSLIIIGYFRLRK